MMGFRSIARMKPTSSSPGTRALSASLREVREARKFGLRELARALEVDPRLLSQWELAIREVVGDADVMSDQIDHLLRLAATSNISVRILPCEVGYHPGKGGMFALYEFPGDPAIVLLEHHHASAFVNELGAIASYRKL